MGFGLIGRTRRPFGVERRELGSDPREEAMHFVLLRFIRLHHKAVGAASAPFLERGSGLILLDGSEPRPSRRSPQMPLELPVRNAVFHLSVIRHVLPRICAQVGSLPSQGNRPRRLCHLSLGRGAVLSLSRHGSLVEDLF